MGKQIHFTQHEIGLDYPAISFPQTFSARLTPKDHPSPGPLQSWCRNHAGAWGGTGASHLIDSQWSQVVSAESLLGSAEFYPSWIQFAEFDHFLKFIPYSVIETNHCKIKLRGPPRKKEGD